MCSCNVLKTISFSFTKKNRPDSPVTKLQPTPVVSVSSLGSFYHLGATRKSFLQSVALSCVRFFFTWYFFLPVTFLCDRHAGPYFTVITLWLMPSFIEHKIHLHPTPRLRSGGHLILWIIILEVCPGSFLFMFFLRFGGLAEKLVIVSLLSGCFFIGQRYEFL